MVECVTEYQHFIKVTVFYQIMEGNVDSWNAT